MTLSRLVVISDHSTVRGGAGALVMLLIRVLRERGLPVTFITGDKGDNPELAELGVEVAPLALRELLDTPRLRAARDGLYNAAAARHVAGWIEARDTADTVYHVHTWQQILSPSVFSALKPVAGRTVLHAHDFFFACPNGAFMDYPRNTPCQRKPLGAQCLGTNCDKRSYKQKLWRSARQFVLRHALAGTEWGRVAVIHERMKPFLVKGGLPASMLLTVPNPADPLTPARVKAEENEAFLYLGRLEREKGIEDAVAAARAAGVRLKVVGDGSLAAQLKKPGDSRIEFLGWKSKKEISELAGSCRALIMPSRSPEPFGLVAAEAILSGLPVIVSDRAFLADEIQASGAGISCRTVDIGTFSEKLSDMLHAPPSEIRMMSEKAVLAGRHICLSRDRWADILLETYDDLLN